MINKLGRGKRLPILLACCMLIFLAACRPQETAEPSLCEALLGETQQQRQDVSAAEAFALCTDVAVGTVISLKTLDDDYMPILVSDGRPESIFYCAVPLEQWAVTHMVVTVKIDRVLSGRTFDVEATATFNIPILFRELLHWDEEESVYTGRSFTLSESEAALPSVEDRIILLQSESQGLNRLVGQKLSFVFCGDQRLNIGWLRPGELSGAYYEDSETEPRWRRNVVPLKETGVSVLEAAYFVPMRARQMLSLDAAEAESGFVVRGTISSATYQTEQAKNLYLTIYLFSEPLERWETDGWQVTVTVDEIKKEDGTALSQETNIVLFLPTQLRRIDGDETLLMTGAIPEVGSAVKLYWNEGFRDASVDWLMRSEAGACDILWAYVDRTPGRPDL